MSSLHLFAQSKVEFDSAAITKILYQHANDDSPGMAVGIIKDGKIVYEHYLGYASLEHKVKVDQHTRFNIASDAKQFTALCILKLIEQGKLELRDDIRQYLPDLYKDIPDKITISNLISHTSGIREYSGLFGLQGKTTWKLFIDNDDVMALIRNQKQLNFKPGTEYLYSNSNYIVLTEIVKGITGQDFSKFAKEMFESLEMHNTDFQTNYAKIIPHRARPYRNWNGWREDPNILEVHGDGALFTTLQDQLKWEQIIQLNDGKYVSKSFITESQAPLSSSIDNGYGYGLAFGRYGGLQYAYHDGSTGAYNATFFRFPTENLSIVVMTNNASVPTNFLAQLIADYTMELPSDSAPYPSKPDEIESLVQAKDVLGIYENNVSGEITKIVEKEGVIYLERYGSDPVKLLPEEEALFKYAINDVRINFRNIGHAGQNFTLYHPSFKPKVYLKLSTSALNNFDKNALTGNFYNEETDTNISIQFIEGNKYSITKNGREREAELFVSDHLRMKNYIININRDQYSNVIGLSVTNGRIQNVIFDKI